MKHRIHFHSDCIFFAGCENMLSVFFNSPKFRDKFDLSFSYGSSEEYEDGLSRRVTAPIRKYPLNTHGNPSGPRAGGLGFLKNSIDNLFLKYIVFAGNILKLYRVMKKEKPDIIHINNGGYPASYSCSAAVFAARLAGKKRIVYVVNNIALPRSSVARKLDAGIDGFVSRNVSRFVTGSSYAGERLKAVLGFADSQYTRIPNTIQNRRSDESREETRSRLGIGVNDFVIANVGLLEERKGQKFLILAFSELVKELAGMVPEVRLVLEGKGSMKGELVALAKDCGLGSKVIFTEERNIFNLYNCLDLFVLSSIAYEDFPNTILEAMSLGKPVVGTNLAGVPEQIEDGGNGLIVEPGNVPQLKEQMKRIVTDASLREKMGSRSRAIFDANFSEDIVIGRYIDLYESLLKAS